MSSSRKTHSREAFPKAALVCLLLISGIQQSFAQGTINYAIRIGTQLVTHVYGVEVPDPTIAKVGNNALETPAGTQTYTGMLLEGSGWSAQLFAALGPGQSESSLTPVATSITTFRTGAAGGTFAPHELEIPGIFPGQTGTFELRAWDNQGGTLATWLAAEPLWLNGSIAAGKSITFDVNLNSATQPGAEMLGFRSFNVYLIPEPGTLALAVLGTAAFLFFRHRLHR